MKNLIDIVKDGLKINNYDGLVNPGLCGCELTDLSPGNCITDDCIPGYKHIHSQSREFIISLSSDKKTDDEIQNVLDNS